MSVCCVISLFKRNGPQLVFFDRGMCGERGSWHVREQEIGNIVKSDPSHIAVSHSLALFWTYDTAVWIEGPASKFNWHCFCAFAYRIGWWYNYEFDLITNAYTGTHEQQTTRSSLFKAANLTQWMQVQCSVAQKHRPSLDIFPVQRAQMRSEIWGNTSLALFFFRWHFSFREIPRL